NLQDTELKNIKNVIGSVLKSAFTENHEAQDILLFEGEKPEIKVKGRWQILESCDKWEQDHFNYFLFNMSNISTKNRDGKYYIGEEIVDKKQGNLLDRKSTRLNSSHVSIS